MKVLLSRHTTEGPSEEGKNHTAEPKTVGQWWQCWWTDVNGRWGRRGRGLFTTLTILSQPHLIFTRRIGKVLNPVLQKGRASPIKVNTSSKFTYPVWTQVFHIHIREPSMSTQLPRWPPSTLESFHMCKGQWLCPCQRPMCLCYQITKEASSGVKMTKQENNPRRYLV